MLNKRDEVLSRMRRIAKAATLEDMDKAIKDFQDSAVWTENTRLCSWFSTKWLPAKKVNRTLVVRSARVKRISCTVREMNRKMYQNMPR